MNKYFIYTGNAYPHKNLSRLIEAMILLNKNRKEKVKLKIVCGRSVFLDRLKTEIIKQNCQDLIRTLGFVPDTELKTLYKGSVAFVFPTLAEGFGLPPMEAIEAGTLVAQSDIPVLKEIYENSAIFFDATNVNSIVLALEECLGLSESERKKKMIYAQKFVKRYSWAKMAKETLKIYHSLQD